MNKEINKTNSDEKLVESYLPKDPGLIARFLSTKAHKQRTMHKSLSAYKAALFFKAADEISKDYDLRAIFDLGHGGISAPSYAYLEVGRDKREELLVTGMRFLVKDSIPLAIYVTPGWGTVDLYVMYNEKHSEQAINFVTSLETYMKENNFYKGEKINAIGQFLPIPDLDFDSIKLPAEKKQAIKVGALEFFNKQEIYEKNKIPFKRGLIFTGLPGTGKTHTGKILMNKSECTFIWVTSDMVDRSSDIRRLFKMAKELAPSILFMEDLDDFLEYSCGVDSLKTQMDGMDDVEGICTILCTNFPDRLPKALIDRPSRFDDIIIFELPDENLRYQILAKIAEPMDIETKEDTLKEIAKNTEGLTGAHLKEILVYSVLLAADSDRTVININDLNKAVEKVKGNTKLNDKLREISVKGLILEIKKSKGEMNNE
jgi:hypothetical protein